MKANELRIGNLLERDDETFAASAYTILLVEGGDIESSPIPLTEEWLLNFGFSKERSSVRENDYWSKGAILGLIKISGFYYHDFIPVTSVHQLQNLYFALTGEELTLKEA